MLRTTKKSQFQFHTGSIKRRCRLFLYHPRNTFQFHTGSIKSTERTDNLITTCEFQFHTGSIKSPITSIEYSLNKFQFHTGSIKRFDANYDNVQSRFNSILVRLKESYPNQFHQTQQCFNSILVRLKVQFIYTLSDVLNGVSIPYWFD